MSNQYTKQEILEKLRTAQNLLSDVYDYACDENIEFVERNMSCADGCIWESINYLENK